MKMFKKKKLLCFLFLFFTFIPFFSVKALEIDNTVFPDIVQDGNDSYMIVMNGMGNSNFGIGTWLVTYNKSDIKYIALYQQYDTSDFPSLGMFKDVYTSSSDLYSSVTYKAYKLENNIWNLTYDRTNTSVSANKQIGGFKKIYYSSQPIYIRKDSATIRTIYNESGSACFGWNRGSTCPSFVEEKSYSSSGKTDVILYEAKEEIISISEKKSFSYNNNEMSNPIRYIDLYFDQEDLQKEINFELKLEDYFNYSSCSYCEYLNIDKFEFSYLTKDENGLYKWNNLSSVGNYVDYDGEKFPRNEDGTGFVLTGRINLTYDTSLYNFEKIRVSIKLSNAYNFKYTYSDNSNITIENIDEYYHYMMYNTEHLNRIEGGSTKYTVLTTTKEEIKSALIIQYVNTDKWLYAEYFDTLNHTYLENSALYQDHYIFSDKEIGKATFTIGKNNSRGLYLMNYLYQRDNKNLNSKYYFYIFDDISYSDTDYLDEAPFYDNEGNFNTGVTSNPNYESDNLHFIDNFRSIFKFLEELKVTSNTFNYMWNSFYNVMPQIVQAFLIFATHILCILIFMKIVGYE